MSEYPYRSRNQGVNQFDSIVVGEEVRVFSGNTKTESTTAKEIAIIPVSKNQTVQVRAYLTGREDSNQGAFGIMGLFTRADRNVSQIGTAGNIFTANNVGTWTGPSFDVDTSTQEIILKVVGKSKKNILWRYRIEYEKI